MRPALRFLVIMSALLCGALPVHAAPDKALERGAAITDPSVLHELDGGRFGLGRMLWRERSVDIPLSNALLFTLGSMAPVRRLPAVRSRVAGLRPPKVRRQAASGWKSCSERTARLT